jgi:hypothetical protein
MPPKSSKKTKQDVVEETKPVIEEVKPIVEEVKPIAEEVIKQVEEVKLVVEDETKDFSVDETISWRELTETEQVKEIKEVKTPSVLDYDPDFYRRLDKTSLSQYTTDDLLRIVSVRGFDNKNPAQWSGARRFMLQLNCEQVPKIKKQQNKQPPPYIKNAPFREQRKMKEKDVREQKKYEKKSFEKKPYEKKSYEGEQSIDETVNDEKSFDDRSFDNRSFDNRSLGGKSFEKKPFEKKPFEKKPFEKKSFEKKPFEKKTFERKPYGESAEYRPPRRESSNTNDDFDIIRGKDYQSSFRNENFQDKPRYNRRQQDA